MKKLGSILTIIGVVLAILLVPILLINNFPTKNIVEPLLCGQDELTTDVDVVENSRRRTKIYSSLGCENIETGETRDVLTRFMIMTTLIAGLPFFIGISLANFAGAVEGVGGWDGYREMREIAKIPEVKVQLDRLIAELKAGRIDLDEYNRRMAEIMRPYQTAQPSVER